MAQCHISWDSYKKNVSNGFSQLQQQQEFVDMTLAAEGHLVKVHKSLLALASPYLKEIILSSPCTHPVVFLTHMKHEVLSYLVEYMYTGEVVVPTHKMDEFIEAAKALHIIGLHSLIPNTKTVIRQQNLNNENTVFFSNDKSSQIATNHYEDDVEPFPSQDKSAYNSQYKEFIKKTMQPGTSDLEANDSVAPNTNPTTEFAATVSADDFDEKTSLIDVGDASSNPEYGKGLQYNMQNNLDNTTVSVSDRKPNSIPNYSINVEMPVGNAGPPKITIDAGVIENSSHAIFNTMQTNDDDNIAPDISIPIPEISINSGGMPSISIGKMSAVDSKKLKENISGPNATALYMISGKGRLQVILNRFIYGVHFQSKQGKKIRWRCIDYRHKRCPAVIDTFGDKIIARKLAHNHTFHDDKIMQRGSRKRVFESLCEASKALEENSSL